MNDNWNRQQLQLQLKQTVAKAALAYIDRPIVLGIGSGTTIFEVIKLLPQYRPYLKQVVAASRASYDLLRQYNIFATRGYDVDHIDLYLDGADELDENLCMIKGGGAALTGEKILAAMADHFVCLVDHSKLRTNPRRLGDGAVPIEIIPHALGWVKRRLQELGATQIDECEQPTEYGNLLLKVQGLDFVRYTPLYWEKALNRLPGVVTNGVFARRPANRALVAYEDRVQTLLAQSETTGSSNNAANLANMANIVNAEMGYAG